MFPSSSDSSSVLVIGLRRISFLRALNMVLLWGAPRSRIELKSHPAAGWGCASALVFGSLCLRAERSSIKGFPSERIYILVRGQGQKLERTAVGSHQACSCLCVVPVAPATMKTEAKPGDTRNRFLVKNPEVRRPVSRKQKDKWGLHSKLPLIFMRFCCFFEKNLPGI